MSEFTMASAEKGEIRPGEKKKRDEPEKGSLRLALGMTCPNRNCFAVDPTSGTAVYPASGMAVLLDTVSCRQTGYIKASSRSISCVNFSPDGQYILLGELGHMPAVRVWSKALDHQVAEFQGHEFGVAYAAFSGNMDLLVSLGTNQDGTIFVWAWPSKERISCNRFAEIIYAMSFSRTEPLFVTCGSHHIRFWYPVTEEGRYAPDTLLGRSVIMRDNKTQIYVDAAFGSERSEKFVYSVTTCGLLCKINSQRQVTQLLQLQKTELTSVQAKDDLLVIATAYGHVHFFNAISMQYKFSICVPLDASLTNHRTCMVPAGGRKTDHRGKMYLGLDMVNQQLTAVLDNGDLCIWNIENSGVAQIKFFASGHNKLISGLDNSLPPRGKKPAYEMMFSVSHDGTVRQWRYSLGHHISCKTTNALYTCNYNPRDPATSDTEVITAIKANPEVGVVVIGDSKGLVTVYGARSLNTIGRLMHHSRGITNINFYVVGEKIKGTQLMLTGGRDRLINVYDIKKDFLLLNSLCLHSGSISALAMVEGADNLMLISSALDRNVIMSCTSKDEPHHFKPCQCRHTTSSVVDINVCPETKWAVLGRSSAVLTVIDTRSFQSLSSFRACADHKASLEIMCVDSRGALLITACSDRSITLLSLPLGLRLACLTGHATAVSGLVLTSDMNHIVSSSRDGCIFIWAMPNRARRRAYRLLKLSIRKARMKVKKTSRKVRSMSIRSLTDLGNKSDGGQGVSYSTAGSRMSISSTKV